MDIHTLIYPGRINCSHTQTRKYPTSNLSLTPHVNFIYIFYSPQTKLREGNVSTGVSQSFCPQEGVHQSHNGAGVHPCHNAMGGVHPAGASSGDASMGGSSIVGDASMGTLNRRQTVNRREVRILVECILVSFRHWKIKALWTKSWQFSICNKMPEFFILKNSNFFWFVAFQVIGGSLESP